MIRPLRSLVALSAALLGLGLAGCGDDEEGTGLEGGISITLSASTLTITQGGSGSVVVTVSRLNGFTGAVAVAAEGLPTGVTAPAISIAAGQTTGTLSFTVASTAAAATTALTIRATGSGITAATTSLSLVVQAAPAAGFTMSLNPTTLSVAQGASGNTTITIARTGSFTGAVALAATGLPNGVTAAFNPASVTGTTSTLTLTASATATTGAATVTITGTGTGVSNQTATLALTVSAGAGGFTLSLNPTTLSVAQGASGNTTITIARTGSFTGAVALAATGLPNGVTAAFNPASVTGTTSTLTLTASATATTGAATVTITGTGTGVSNQSATVALTVTASTGGSGNVTLDYSACTGTQASVKPIWVAAQDGATGTWTRVTPTNDVYRFNVTQAKGGYAAATQNGNNTTVTVSLFAQSEITAAPFAFCTSSAGTTKTVNVTVQGVGQTDIANIGLGGGAAVAIGATLQNPVSIQNVQSGVHDLVAYRSSLAGGPTLADRAFIIRDLNVAAGGSAGTIDFNGAGNSGTLASATITLTGTQASEQYIAAMQYLTGAQCTGGTLWTVANSGAQVTALGIPASYQRNTDFHNFVATSTTSTVTRVVTETFRVLGAPRSVALGTVFTPTVTTLAGSYKRLQAVVTVPTEYNFGANLTYLDATGARAALVVPTPAWIGGTQATIAFPDFTGVSGWSDSWMPASSATVNWNVAAIGGTVSANLCSEGRRTSATSVRGTL